MSMVLNNHSLVRGISPRTAKKICELCQGYPRSAQDVANSLSVTEATAVNWLVALSESGYVDVETEEGQVLWSCSARGYTELATARFGGKLLSGSEFSQLLLTVVQRAREYNESEVYPLYIDKMYIFGAILSQPWQAGDPNITIVTSERARYARQPNWRFVYWRERDPEKHLGIVEQICFAENELKRFLQKPKEHLSLYHQEISEISDERRLLYVRDGIDMLEDDSLMTKSDIEDLGVRIEEHRKAEAKRGSRASTRLRNEKIIDYWRGRDEFLGLGLPLEDAVECCWRCRGRGDIQQCHIVPKALGGKYVESNLVLLCGRCHAEGPNLANEKIMFDWIGAYRNRYGDDFWRNVAMDEYERIYGKTLRKEVEDILHEVNPVMKVDDAMAALNLIVNEVSASASVHFGQQWLNNSTMAGCFRLALDRLPGHLREM